MGDLINYLDHDVIIIDTDMSYCLIPPRIMTTGKTVLPFVLPKKRAY